jgi:hypothetical protein
MSMDEDNGQMVNEEIVPPPEGGYETPDERDSSDDEQNQTGAPDYEEPPEEGSLLANVDDDTEDHNVSNGRQNYCLVKRQCDELCRAIANNQPKLQSVLATVTEMIDRV